MSIVKRKRGSAPEVSARREAELTKRWRINPTGKLITAIYRPRRMIAGPVPCGENSIDRSKTQASVRIDADVMEWLKRPGKGYQTRLDAILREAMLRDQNKK